MIKEIIATGKDITEAKENARLALGADELADVKYEILHAGSHGIFGIIGVKQAQVKATMEIPDAVPRVTHRANDSRPRENRDNRNNRAPRQNRDRRPRPERPEVPECPPDAIRPPKKRSEVIPETALKLTRVEVAPGDDRSLDFVNTLIANIGLSAEASLFSAEDGSRRIVVSGSDASALIGHHGETLDSLQYLANLACAQNNAKGERDHSRVTVDIEGYRAKREDALRALARRMAEKALRTKRNVMLEPMNPYERRIIHDEVSQIAGVTTSSVGADSSRRVVIYFDKKNAPAPAEVAPVAAADAVEKTVSEKDADITIEITEEPVTEAVNEAAPEANEATAVDVEAETEEKSESETLKNDDTAL